MKDAPYFEAWDHKLLAVFAADNYARVQSLKEAVEQLRLDLKDAMKLAREANK